MTALDFTHAQCGNVQAPMPPSIAHSNAPYPRSSRPSSQPPPPHIPTKQPHTSSQVPMPPTSSQVYTYTPHSCTCPHCCHSNQGSLLCTPTTFPTGPASGEALAQSAVQCPIAKECATGHTAGPFITPSSCFRHQPTGAMPKKRLGKWHLIMPPPPRGKCQ